MAQLSVCVSVYKGCLTRWEAIWQNSGQQQGEKDMSCWRGPGQEYPWGQVEEEEFQGQEPCISWWVATFTQGVYRGHQAEIKV